MAYVIAEPCIERTDQSCVQVCPVDCITADPEVDVKFYIDPEVCIDCGACASACPNAAIFRQDQLPPEWARYASIDAAWYRDADTARSALADLLPVA